MNKLAYLIHMRFFLFVALLLYFSPATAQPPAAKPEAAIKKVLLPNGWSLTPPANSLALGDLPLNIAVSPSQKYLAVINCGQSVQSLQLIDPNNEKILDSVDVPKCWFGLKFSADDKFLYVSGGNDNRILVYSITNGKLMLADNINLGQPWMDDEATAKYHEARFQKKAFKVLFFLVALGTLLLAFWKYRKQGYSQGLLILGKGALIGAVLFIAAVIPWYFARVHYAPQKISPAGIDVDNSNHLLYVVTKENNSLYVIDLNTKKVKIQLSLPGEAYTCLLSDNKKELYISCWGCGEILVFDTHLKKIIKEIPVGEHPNDLCLSPDNQYLFVANANDNSVSVVDVSTGKSVETLNAALYPNAPQGSTTNAVALSPDAKTLYAANADNNCLAVFDVSTPGKSVSKGFIPVGWYPTAVKVVGQKIFVANGKGYSSLPNPDGPNPAQEDNARKGKKPEQFIASLFKGTLSIIPVPDEKALSDYSGLVYENTPYTKSKELQASGEPGNPVPSTVGDSSPIKYVFYIIKENRTYDQVLGDMTEGNGDTSLVLFGEKITPNQHALAKQFVLLDNFYCDAEVSADGHNWSLGAYATDYLEKTWPSSYGGRGGNYDGEGRRAIANNKNGFLWDLCRRKNISYRTYGEFISDDKPSLAVLQNHYCESFPGWNLSIRDTTRVARWKKDFDSLYAGGTLPRLNTIYFGNDHTEGLVKGTPTPFAHVADNDLAVGELIEHLSKSPVWKESVVFIVEDDAQNGPDHVDAHRTIAFVAGGYVKRHVVDHSMYSTSSLLRTIELILGLPPMSQYDAASTPMWRSFSSKPDLSVFQAVPANVDLNDLNKENNELARKSAGFDFTREDRVPEDKFNEVLWKSIKGMHAKPIPPVRAAFIKSITAGNDDDK